MLKSRIRLNTFLPFVVALIVTVLFFQLGKWQSSFTGIFLFLVYGVTVGLWWQYILGRVFGWPSGRLESYVLAFFAVLVLLGLVSGIWVVWYRVTPLILWLCYLIVAAVSFVLFLCVSKKPKCRPLYHESASTSPERKIRFRLPSFFVFIYLMLWIWGIVVLFQSQTNRALFSPWQTISETYLWIFFVASLLLGLFLFSRFKIRMILFLVVFHSFLAHLYVPATHILPWGGDVWRMMAVEEKLTAGDIHPPVLFGKDAAWRDIGSLSVPEALIIPHKYVYGQLWGTTVLLAKTIHIDVLQLNRWLVPLLWSILLPYIFFRIGIVLFGNQRWGLWLSALSVVPFSFQALGGLTLGVSLGYLTFFFVFALLLHAARDRHPWQRNIVLLFGLLMAFGYTLFFLLFWLIFFIIFIVRWIMRWESTVLKTGVMTTVLFLSMFFFPVIELIAHASFVPEGFSFVERGKQAVGQLSGWFFATAIRPHDIVSGNIIFNHLPIDSFVSSAFTNWRWHIVGLMVFFFLCAGIGVCVGQRRHVRMVHALMRVLGFAVWGGYLIGWFILGGERSFIRRLDGMLAFTLLIFFLFGIQTVLQRRQVSINIRRILVGVTILLFSWSTTTIYASGPDMRVMSIDEYQAAALISNHTGVQTSVCVLADTWPLLALETVSRGAVVGGGFPIDALFGQPERIFLYTELLREPRLAILEVAGGKTGISTSCWGIVPQEVGLRSNLEKAFSEMNFYQELGTLSVFQVPLKTGSE